MITNEYDGNPRLQFNSKLVFCRCQQGKNELFVNNFVFRCVFRRLCNNSRALDTIMPHVRGLTSIGRS